MVPCPLTEHGFKDDQIHFLLQQGSSQYNKQLTKSLICEDSYIIFEIYSGASVSVADHDIYTKYLAHKPLFPTTCTLRIATNNFLSDMGEVAVK